MSLDGSLIPFGEFQLGEVASSRAAGQPSRSARSVKLGGDGRQPQFTQQQRQPRCVDFDRVAGAVSEPFAR